jgi:Fe2+ transport system protein B
MKKGVKTYAEFDGVADDAFNDVDYRTPSKWSRNNIWSKRSPRGPYDSPHSTSDEDAEAEFGDREYANRADRVTTEPANNENERYEHSSQLERLIVYSVQGPCIYLLSLFFVFQYVLYTQQ